jgi:hypothetical protein
VIKIDRTNRDRDGDVEHDRSWKVESNADRGILLILGIVLTAILAAVGVPVQLPGLPGAP